MKLIIIFGIIVQLTFLFSIFDIYFKSPVVTGITPLPDLNHAPAKRLVLIVADGLRADTFFRLNDDDSSKAPYLRSILSNRGTWGVSHTRVPTESRPGHVAIIAGLYEDPSAVVRGWQENPVDFDSVFNRSIETWCWGSPDILPMFSKGANQGKVHIDHYGAEEEDFSGKIDTSLLDTWVFDKVEKFFEESKDNENLSLRLKQNKIIFFLHLLGLDTAGHTYKPFSKELDNNLKIVDNGVQKIENIIENYYNYDNKTAYIFTSDHGMTNWGSHGSGSSHETETPIVSWGAGVNRPKGMISSKKTITTSPLEWGVNDRYRRDIMQADVTPLIATLIGTAVPVNSVGILPSLYVNATHDYLAKAYFSNSRQLASQYQQKRAIIEIGLWSIFKRPFKDLDDNKMNITINNIKHLISTKRYDDAIDLSTTLMSLSIGGLNYYHTYYQVLLLLCISLSYVGWIFLLVISIFFTENYTHSGSTVKNITQVKYITFVDVIFTFLVTFTLGLIFAQSLPKPMYLYCILPILLWWIVCRKVGYVINVMRIKTGSDVLKDVGRSILYLIGAAVLVLSFFYRYFLSFCLLLLCLWGCAKMNKRLMLLKFQWIVSSLTLAIFPTMPVVKEGSTLLIFLGGLAWILMAIWHCKKFHFVTSFIQLLLLISALSIVISTRSNFESRLGLSWSNMIGSWLLLVVSTLLVFSSSTLITVRLKYIGKGLAVPFMLLSVNHEPLFLFTLLLHIDAWLQLEHHVSRTAVCLSDAKFDKRSQVADATLRNSDFRRSYLFLFYIMVSFFGTGNIASLSSFDPSWVRCFVARFSPFIMGGLIILKTLIPFHLVTCYWHATNILEKVPTKKLFLAVLIFSNVMGFHFLFLVRNEGSWMDIGTSISHYVIMQMIVVVLLVIFTIAKGLTSFKWFADNDKSKLNYLECGKLK